MSVSRVRENRMHGSKRRREATPASQASTRCADGQASRRPYNDQGSCCMSHAPLEKLVTYKRRRGWTVPYVSAHGGDLLFDYGYAFRREQMSGIVRDEFDMGQLLREAPQWLRDYRE